MSGILTSAEHQAAALLYQRDGDWASVVQEYQMAIDTLDPTAGVAVNGPKIVLLQAKIADAFDRSRGFIGGPDMLGAKASAGTASGVLSTAIRAIGTGGSADAGSLLAA